MFKVPVVFLIHLTCIFYFQHIVQSYFLSDSVIHAMVCHHDNNYLKQVQSCINCYYLHQPPPPPPSSSARFIEMAPQYFFYNLPPSGSKKFLQDLLDHGSPHSPGREAAPLEEEQQADTRCVLQ